MRSWGGGDPYSNCARAAITRDAALTSASVCCWDRILEAPDLLRARRRGQRGAMGSEAVGDVEPAADEGSYMRIG